MLEPLIDISIAQVKVLCGQHHCSVFYFLIAFIARTSLMSKEFCVQKHSLDGGRKKSIFVLFFCAITIFMNKITKGDWFPRLIKARKAELRTLFETVT